MYPSSLPSSCLYSTLCITHTLRKGTVMYFWARCNTFSSLNTRSDFTNIRRIQSLTSAVDIHHFHIVDLVLPQF
ncbi:Protein of unknown function [Pyronema omphalodes CBS 100304]|uniref:Uncharacterized protein n=1 Tax=Pyronema omphalodes (strain CBS 100304) TaxID=1076935 RepID=U4LNF6_PYROM|nr:Protein of unknown function [Pyronema omphalodes CBS 100304]